jgi:hypothetical protein
METLMSGLAMQFIRAKMQSIATLRRSGWFGREPALDDLDDWCGNQDDLLCLPEGRPALGRSRVESQKMHTEKEPLAFDEEDLAPPTPSNRKVEPAVEAAAVYLPAEAESAAKRAQEAKSLLAGLDLDTAIRLRWVMRDINAKRTKLSPVSENDLAALMDLGFVEMQQELPRLTPLGLLSLE